MSLGRRSLFASDTGMDRRAGVGGDWCAFRSVAGCSWDVPNGVIRAVFVRSVQGACSHTPRFWEAVCDTMFFALRSVFRVEIADAARTCRVAGSLLACERTPAPVHRLRCSRPDRSAPFLGMNRKQQAAPKLSNPSSQVIIAVPESTEKKSKKEKSVCATFVSFDMGTYPGIHALRRGARAPRVPAQFRANFTPGPPIARVGVAALAREAQTIAKKDASDFRTGCVL